MIQSLWEDLHALLRDGALARETAELRLHARDLDLLDGKIEPGLWYPNETYVRYAQLLAEVAPRDGRRVVLDRAGTQAP